MTPPCDHAAAPEPWNSSPPSSRKDGPAALARSRSMAVFSRANPPICRIVGLLARQVLGVRLKLGVRVGQVQERQPLRASRLGLGSEESGN